MARLPIKHAESGRVITVDIKEPFRDDAVTELRSLLSAATGISRDDQILLIGPPYRQLKRFDPPLHYSSASSAFTTSHETISARDRSTSPADSPPRVRSIFLYDRRTLDEDSTCSWLRTSTPLQVPELPVTSTTPVPAAIGEPHNPQTGPGAGWTSSWSSELQMLRRLERVCALNVAVGHAYVERARCALEGGVQCVEEQRIQRDAGEVALANLLDHLNAITRDGHDLLQRHAAQADKHRALLDATDNTQLRAKLEGRTLHPALVSALTHALSSSSSSSPSGADATMQTGLSACAGCAALAKAQQQPQETEAITLLDCVPTKRVRDWHRECVSTCERLSAWMSELSGALDGLQDRAEQQKASFTQAVPSPPVVDVLKRPVGEQERAVAALERGYGELVERVGACGGGTEEVVEVCQWVEGLLNRQAGVMAEMEGRDHDMLTHVRTVVKRKSLVTRWLAGTLLSISRLQSEMASLRADVAMGEQALDAERRHLGQLDHLDRLVAAYDAMLLELTRRRAYANLFETKVKAALHDLGTVREAEVAARQHFLSHHAPHLVAAMPVIQHFVFPLATMQDRPPHFHARALTLTEHTLPPVNVLADDDEYRRQDTTPGGGDDQHDPTQEYSSLLLRSRCKGGGGEGVAAGGSGSVIMPGCDGEEETDRSRRRLEERCLAQDVEVARLKALLLEREHEIALLKRVPGTPSTPKEMPSPAAPLSATSPASDDALRALEEERQMLREEVDSLRMQVDDSCGREPAAVEERKGLLRRVVAAEDVAALRLLHVEEACVREGEMRKHVEEQVAELEKTRKELLRARVDVAAAQTAACEAMAARDELKQGLRDRDTRLRDFEALHCELSAKLLAAEADAKGVSAMQQELSAARTRIDYLERVEEELIEQGEALRSEIRQLKANGKRAVGSVGEVENLRLEVQRQGAELDELGQALSSIVSITEQAHRKAFSVSPSSSLTSSWGTVGSGSLSSEVKERPYATSTEAVKLVRGLVKALEDRISVLVEAASIAEREVEEARQAEERRAMEREEVMAHLQSRLAEAEARLTDTGCGDQQQHQAQPEVQEPHTEPQTSSSPPQPLPQALPRSSSSSTSPTDSRRLIAYYGLRVGDLALFLRQRHGLYKAFNEPNRFLCREAVADILGEHMSMSSSRAATGSISAPGYIIRAIKSIEKREAAAGDPYQLQPGSIYYVLTPCDDA